VTLTGEAGHEGRISSSDSGGVTNEQISVRDRIWGGLFGLLVGDALGVPYEFHPAASLPSPDEIDFQPPEGFRRTYPSVPPGTWSDDGAQALCLATSLLELGRLDTADLAERFLSWLNEGYMTPSGVFDVGRQTAAALGQIGAGVPELKAAPSGEMSNGNGSLMRVLPLALWHLGSDVDMVADAHLQSRITHPHVRSQVCCALYCLWARRELEGTPDSWNAAVTILRGMYAEHPQYLFELEANVEPDRPPGGSGTGYVVDCLHSARLACQDADYEAVVRTAVPLGNDTDTTACVAGGIAGLRHGINGIPTRWRNSLRGSEIPTLLAAKLTARRT
jgi:ADP-ribosyl-[dinitrogen reductase] hydrolase